MHFAKTRQNALTRNCLLWTNLDEKSHRKAKLRGRTFCYFPPPIIMLAGDIPTPISTLYSQYSMTALCNPVVACHWDTYRSQFMRSASVRLLGSVVPLTDFLDRFITLFEIYHFSCSSAYFTVVLEMAKVGWLLSSRPWLLVCFGDISVPTVTSSCDVTYRVSTPKIYASYVDIPYFLLQTMYSAESPSIHFHQSLVGGRARSS